MSLQRRKALGFTLVELMIVVAIISVLAVIAGTAYRKYMDSGRSAEVYAMLGEIRGKEEAYMAEYSKYLGTDTSETNFFPALLAAHNEPKAKSWIVGTPATWSAATGLGLSPTKTMLYCGYVVIAGLSNVTVAGTRGKPLFSNYTGSTPTVPWWYAIATCDNDGDGNINSNAYFETTSQATNVVVIDEHK